MTKSPNYLIDVNVWLALVLEDHQHHIVAIEAIVARREHHLYFCRATQQALLRLLSQSAATGGFPVPMHQCWTIYQELMKEHEVDFLDEPAGIETAWRQLTMLPLASPKRWMDAYLQAFAQCAGLRLLTFDRALAQASGGECLLT